MVLADIAKELPQLDARTAAFVAVMYTALRVLEFLYNSWKGKKTENREDIKVSGDQKSGFIGHLLSRISDIEEDLDQQRDQHLGEIKQLKELHRQDVDVLRGNMTLQEKDHAECINDNRKLRRENDQLKAQVLELGLERTRLTTELQALKKDKSGGGPQ